MKNLAVAFGFLIALTACEAEQAPPVVSNTVLPPKVALDVQSITLTDRSPIQAANSPYNTNHFTPTINEAIRRWAGDRLQAAGQDGQAIILIKDASLTALPIPVQTGFDSWFTRQQGVKYNAHAEVSIEANNHGGFATADAVATRVVTLPENPTAIEKQDAYYTLLNELMKDLGQNMDAAIQGHLSGFITNMPVFGTTALPVNAISTTPVTLPPAPPTPASITPSEMAPMATAPAPLMAPMQPPAIVPLSGPGSK